MTRGKKKSFKNKFEFGGQTKAVGLFGVRKGDLKFVMHVHHKKVLATLVNFWGNSKHFGR